MSIPSFFISFDIKKIRFKHSHILEYHGIFMINMFQKISCDRPFSGQSQPRFNNIIN